MINILNRENLAICWNIRVYLNTLNKIKVKISNCGQSAGKARIRRIYKGKIIKVNYGRK